MHSPIFGWHADGVGALIQVMRQSELSGAWAARCEAVAGVVALARIALDGLVGEDRALHLQHGAADDVFGRDQLDDVLLACQFVGDERVNGGDGSSEIAGREDGIVGHGNLGYTETTPVAKGAGRP
jgi:hypothetical protein